MERKDLEDLIQRLWDQGASIEIMKILEHDKQQRETLARVEAEQTLILNDVQRFARKILDTKAKLAEAVVLLRAINRDIWPEWESRFGNSAALINVQAFLADQARAEQQEYLNKPL